MARTEPPTRAPSAPEASTVVQSSAGPEAPAATSVPPVPTRRWRMSPKAASILCLVVLTVLSGAYWAAHLPGLSGVAGWFYRPSNRGLGEAWAVAAFALVVPALGALMIELARRQHRVATALVALLLGVTAHSLMVPIDAGGRETLQRRHVEGHGEYHRVAWARRGQMWSTTRDYEQLAEDRALGHFARSKPPGTLFAYFLLDRIGTGLGLSHLPQARAFCNEHVRLQAPCAGVLASVFLFPLCSGLLVMLAFILGLAAHRKTTAAAQVALLVACSPGLLLITYHLDGSLMPVLAVASISCAFMAIREGRFDWLWAFLSGVIAGVACFVSFAMLIPTGLALATFLMHGFERRAHKRAETHLLRDIGALIAAFLVGCLGFTVVMALAFDYAPVLRFVRGMEHHARWKAGVPKWPWKALGFVEFTLYAGVPFIVAVFLAAGSRFLEAIRARTWPTREHLLPVGAVAVLVVLSLGSGTNEVARLWLFMVPLLALALVRPMDGAKHWQPMAMALLVLTFIMKANQPW